MLRATRHDWEITLAASGRQALMMLDALTIDVIVTDLDMPDLDGISLLEQCARRHPRVVRVVHSSHLETSEQTKVRRLAQLIVNKPARPAELIAVLERALDAGRSNDGNGTGGSEACG
jgi:DNA-binding NtrC family response regulator